MAALRDDLFYRRIVSKKHLDTLAQFMERYPTLALARARSRDGKESARKKWDKIAIALNKIDPNIARNGRNWCRYWYDLKFKIRRKYACIKKCQSEGIQCALTMSSFEERMAKVLTDKEGNLYPTSTIQVADIHSQDKQVQIKTEQPTVNDVLRSNTPNSNDDDHDDDELDSEGAQKNHKDNHIKIDTNIYEHKIVIKELSLEEDYSMSPTEDSTTEVFQENDTNSTTTNSRQENDPIKIESKDVVKLKMELLEFELAKRKEVYEIEKKQRREKHELEVAILRLKRDFLIKEMKKL